MVNGNAGSPPPAGAGLQRVLNLDEDGDGAVVQDVDAHRVVDIGVDVDVIEPHDLLRRTRTVFT